MEPKQLGGSSRERDAASSMQGQPQEAGAVGGGTSEAAISTGGRRVFVSLRACSKRNLPLASAWGTDWIGETKVPSPLGAVPAKDQCEHVGHLVAFGNTEESCCTVRSLAAAPTAYRRPGPRPPAPPPL